MQKFIRDRIEKARLGVSRPPAPQSPGFPKRRHIPKLPRTPALPRLRPEKVVDLDKILTGLVSVYRPSDCLERFAVKCLAQQLQKRARLAQTAAALRASIEAEYNRYRRRSTTDRATPAANLDALKRSLQFIVRYQSHLARSQAWLIESLHGLQSRR